MHWKSSLNLKGFFIYRSKPGAGNASIVSARQQKLRSTVIEQIEKKQRKEEQDSLDDVEI